MQEQDEIEDDPNDPAHPDFDLSEAAASETGWSYEERTAKPWFIRRWALLIVAILVIVALVVPLLPR
jgi:hypothetical protein